MSTTKTTDTTPARTAAGTYFDAWKAQDWGRLRGVLHEDVTFRGPLGTADGADACLEGIKGMTRMVTGIEVRAVTTDGADVVTVFELTTTVAGPILTANWSRVGDDGRITQIRVAFDPRPILEAA